MSVDRDLLEASNILPHRQVDICDYSNGNRVTPHAIAGERGSGEICVNGAAAHLVKPHDLVIICSDVQLDEAGSQGWKATRVFVGERNRTREIA